MRPYPSQANDRPLATLPTLFRFVTWPHLRENWQDAVFVVLTISLGVSAIVASGTLIESTLASMRNTAAVTTTKADLRISNGFSGVPESLLEELRALPEVTSANAMLTATAGARFGAEFVNMTLIAVDLLGENELAARGLSQDSLEVADESDFLTKPNAIALPRGFAAERGLNLGTRFEAETAAGRKSFFVAGLFGEGYASLAAGGAVALMDLPAAQYLLDRGELVGVIDIRLRDAAEPSSARRAVESVVGERGIVADPALGSAQWDSLLFNIRLTLGLTGAVGAIVGALVIYHVVALAISRRKPRLDVIRSLGVSRKAMLGVLSIEGIVMGAVGAALGAVTGVALAWLATQVFQQNISAIYMAVAEPAFLVPTNYIAFGMLLGIGIAWGVSLGPVLGALKLGGGPVVDSSRRDRWRTAVRLALAGASIAAVGLLLPSANRLGAEAEWLSLLVNASDALVLVGIGFMGPILLWGLSPAVERLLRSSRFLSAKLAWGGLQSDPVRSATVLTAVLLGAAYTAYTVAAVGSLREGILDWLDTSGSSDLVVAAAGSIGLFPSSPAIPPDLNERIAAHPSVARTEIIQMTSQPFRDRWVVVHANAPEMVAADDDSTLLSGDLAKGRAAIAAGTGTIVTEQIALLHGIAVGEVIELRSPGGSVPLRVEAVVDEFTGGDLGSVFVSPSLFSERWKDDSVRAVHVWLGEDAARAELADAIRTSCDCDVMTRAELSATMKNLVDSVFYFAYALELVAVFVMVASIFSFFSITLRERERDLSLLRIVGATRRQMAAAYLVESILIGAIGSTLGTIFGLLLSWRFVTGAMAQGTGLQMNFVIPVDAALFVLISAIVVCPLAAMSPIFRLSMPTERTALGNTVG